MQSAIEFITSARSFPTLLLVLSFVVAVPGARAQITVEAGDLDALAGQTFEATLYTNESPSNTAALQALAGATGEGDTYDFSAITFPTTLDGSLGYYDLPADVPGSDREHFADADVVVEIAFGDAGTDTTIWSFSEIRSDGIYSLGVVMPLGEDFDGDGAPDTLTLENDPATFSSPLSYTYGDSWTIEGGFGGDTQVEVTGYGTLVGPDGTSRHALRLRNTTTAGGITFTSVEFVTSPHDGGAAVSASLSLGPAGTVTDVSYTHVSATSGTAVDRGTTPEAYRLGANYPNPFNPETVIPYEVPQSGPVTLRVFDALGREVATLVDGHQAVGPHTAVFDAGALPSGVYLYRLQAGAFSETRVMTLLR